MDTFCKQQVHDPGMIRGRQCANGVFKDGYCNIHHPTSASKRYAKSQALSDAKMEKWRNDIAIQAAERVVIDAAKAWHNTKDDDDRILENALGYAINALNALTPEAV